VPPYRTGGLDNRSRAGLPISVSVVTKSSLIVRQLEPGFDAFNLLTRQITLPTATYATANQRELFFSEVLRRVESLPGVRSAAVAMMLPLSGRDAATEVEIEGHPAPLSAASPTPTLDAVSPSYVRAMRIPILRGRPLTEQDGASERGVALINAQMARRFWPNSDPIGRRIRLRGGQPSWYTIVGVVGDVKYARLDEPAAARTYLHHARAASAGMSLVVRSAQDPARLTEAVRNTVWSVDRDQPIADTMTMEQRFRAALRRDVQRPSYVRALVALIVAMAATFGVMMCWPPQRDGERGAPASLWTRQRKILGLMERDLPMLLLSVTIGLSLAVTLKKSLNRLFFGVTPTDSGILGFSVSVLSSAMLLASYLSAWTASRRVVI